MDLDYSLPISVVLVVLLSLFHFILSLFLFPDIRFSLAHSPGRQLYRELRGPPAHAIDARKQGPLLLTPHLRRSCRPPRNRNVDGSQLLL